MTKYLSIAPLLTGFLASTLISISGIATGLCDDQRPYAYGFNDVGPISDQRYPFIDGSPVQPCTLQNAEIATMRSRLFDKVPDVPADKQKVAIFTMGAPGSGKSSSIEKVLLELHIDKNAILTIDPDDLRNDIGDFYQATHVPSEMCPGKFRAYAQAVTHCVTAGRAARNVLLQEAMNGRKNFIFDSPCSGTQYCVDQMKLAREHGFRVYLVAVYAPVEALIERAKSRAFLTGRYTEETFVRKTFDEIRGNFLPLARAALESGGRGYIYDNSGTAPNIVLQMKITTDRCNKNNAACTYFLGQF